MVLINYKELTVVKTIHVFWFKIKMKFRAAHGDKYSN